MLNCSRPVSGYDSSMGSGWNNSLAPALFCFPESLAKQGNELQLRLYFRLHIEVMHGGEDERLLVWGPTVLDPLHTIDTETDKIKLILSLIERLSMFPCIVYE